MYMYMCICICILKTQIIYDTSQPWRFTFGINHLINNVKWFVDICCGFDADLSWICPETGDLPSMHIHLIQHGFSITCPIKSTCVLHLKVAL